MHGALLGLYWGHIGVLLGLYWGCIGIMKRKTETTIQDLCWGYIGAYGIEVRDRFDALGLGLGTQAMKLAEGRAS